MEFNNNIYCHAFKTVCISCITVEYCNKFRKITMQTHVDYTYLSQH